jgi:ribosomal protein S18 acetylase RimI-like enzyme
MIPRFFRSGAVRIGSAAVESVKAVPRTRKFRGFFMVETSIRFARESDLPVVRRLFADYVEWLGIDLAFQGFEAELRALPGKYAPPAGRLLLAVRAETAAGCVGLRPLESGICEMKRLWVVPGFRRYGIGAGLVDRVIAEAAQIGYRKMRLDTLAQMTSALELYRSRGFREIPPYYYNPIPETVYLELDLPAP